MRFTFICSSLEPGRDGVGDYTRMLADSLVRQGHSTSLIALNDRHATGVAPGAAALRLAASEPWADRVSRARRVIEDFAPDWVSLQFVPFGFDDRGLVWRLGDRLASVIGTRRTHVMFHELWGGDGRSATLGQRVQGRLQRRLVMRMVRRLRPAIVHTHASPYVTMLRAQGVPATRLPLFGNIPVSRATNRAWLDDAFRAAGIPPLREDRQDLWLFGLFGTLHREWTSEPLLSRIRHAAASQGRRPVLVAIGRLGAAGEAIWDDIERTYPDISRLRIGEQSGERVSQALQALDFGLAASPLSLIGKSSTAATMRAHGLPVIVSRNDIDFAFDWDHVETRDPLLIPLGDDLAERLAQASRTSPSDTVDAVARQFLTSLQAAGSCVS